MNDRVSSAAQQQHNSDSSSSEPGKWEPSVTEFQLATSAAQETAREILVTLLGIYAVPDIFKALGKHDLKSLKSEGHFSIFIPHSPALSLLGKLRPRRGYVMFPRSHHEAQRAKEKIQEC